ncbi:MAG: hypothetical protein QM724_11475 [Flavobacteriales bacterium]
MRIEQVVAETAELRQPLRVLHRGVEDVAVDEPVRHAAHVQRQLVYQAQIAQARGAVPAQGLVVVAGDVVHRHFGGHLHEALQHLHVLLGEPALVELPDVDDVAVQHYRSRPHRAEVGVQFLRAATIGPQVKVGQDEEVDRTLRHGCKGIAPAWPAHCPVVKRM